MQQETPDPRDGIAFVGGRYMPLSEASVPILDRGFVRSDATYDVAHVWQGRIFRLDDHIERFFASMRGLRMSLPYDKAALTEILVECVRRSGLRDAYLQMTCTRGIPPRGTRDPRLCENRLYVFVQPFVWIANAEQQRQGLTMVVSSVARIPPDSVDPRIKNFHWLDLTMGIFEAYDRDALVAVLKGPDGTVTEGAGFNLFVVRDGRLATPESGVFEGMTRRTVLDFAGDLGLEIEVRPVLAEELAGADEVFITSTAGGIMPVTVVDGRILSNGRPGPVTGRVRDLYWARHDEGWRMTPIDYRD
ncbi:aminotransferase class IV [Ensifer soli]|uniref:aminotransferase class IV n=1 Tax=Ciceribacter sp. sgz301302 TaxID=3342379 RepID=UPI0035B766CA